MDWKRRQVVCRQLGFFFFFCLNGRGWRRRRGSVYIALKMTTLWNWECQKTPRCLARFTIWSSQAFNSYNLENGDEREKTTIVRKFLSCHSLSLKLQPSLSPTNPQFKSSSLSIATLALTSIESTPLNHLLFHKPDNTYKPNPYPRIPLSPVDLSFRAST
jgi:hypothetical protein